MYACREALERSTRTTPFVDRLRQYKTQPDPRASQRLSSVPATVALRLDEISSAGLACHKVPGRKVHVPSPPPIPSIHRSRCARSQSCCSSVDKKTPCTVRAGPYRLHMVLAPVPAPSSKASELWPAS
jgi:hypothetical protein